MNAWRLVFILACGTLVAEETPEILTKQLEQVEQTTARARARLGQLSEANRRALDRLAEEGAHRPDPALWLWAERERRVHETTPFCNLTRPERVTGYPEELRRLSGSLREELSAFLGLLKDQRDKRIQEAESAFDLRVRTLVRGNDIEGAEREQDAFKGFTDRKAVKNLDRFIRQVDRLVSGKSHRGLWRRPKNDPTPAPPDAIFLFEAGNPAFRTYLENVSVVSNGSHDRGNSGAAVGGRIRVSGKRGLTILALVGGEEVLRGHYDTYESKSEGLRLVEDVKALPYGAFVVLFAHDDATRRFPGEAQSTLFRLGASQGLAGLPYRSAYLLIGVKGMRPGGAVEIADGERVVFPVEKEDSVQAEQ